MGLWSLFKSLTITQLLLGYIFLASGFLVSFLMLIGMVIWPFSRNLYRKFAYVLSYALWSRKYMQNTVVLFSINPFPNKPWFLRVCNNGLLKTLWEKEKLLVMSNFSFSHSVFYPFGQLSAIFIKFEIVVFKLFQFERVTLSV